MATPSAPPALPPSGDPTESAYRQTERRYRLRRVPLNAKQTKFARQDPDLEGVLDFAAPNIDADPRVRRLGPEEADMRGLLQLGHGGGGAENDSNVRVYALRNRPGVYYIPGALGERAQARWARTCLARFSRSQHTNLTNLARQSEGPAASSSSSLWADAVRQVTQEEQPPQGDNLDAAIKALLRPLRWANIGQNYDWGSRRYAVDVTRRPAPAPAPSDDGADGAFHRIPPSLRALVRAAVAPLGLSCEAEAGIVNYYPSDASMGGHVDDAEGALAHPVVSFSLGLAAVFLLGGPTKDSDDPIIPLLVRSGDCLVMGGASRLCVHGVPAVLTDSARPPTLLTDGAALLASRFWEEEEDGKGEPCSEAEAALLARYMATSRVNFNLRQVWPSEEGEEEEAA